MNVGAAVFSECDRYRYTLSRKWVNGQKNLGVLGAAALRNGPCVFVMLNPSTADADLDDPTITRCIGFARSWGYRQLIVVNLFALRSTDSMGLLEVSDPVGPENDNYLLTTVHQADVLVAAWGSHKKVGPIVHARAREVLSMIPGRPMCLGVNRDGSPKHPLYLKADTKLITYEMEHQ